jgi:hypothetical protein
VVARFRPIGGGGEALVARDDELDRPPEHLGRDRDEAGARRDRGFAAEGAAHIRRHGMDLGRIDLDLRRQPVLQADDRLARLVDRQLVARPRTGGGVELDRVVMLRRRLVAGVDLDRRRREGRVGVAGGRVLVHLADRRVFARVRPLYVEARARRLGRVGDAHLMGGLAGIFEPFRYDEGDDLALMVDAVAGERRLRGHRHAAVHDELELAEHRPVLVRHDVQHAGHLLGLSQVDAGDAALGDRACHQIRVGGITDREVGRVAGRARDLGASVEARLGPAHVLFRLRRRGAHVKSPKLWPARARG